MSEAPGDVQRWPAPDTLFAKQDTPAFARNEGKALDAGLEPCTHCGRGVAPGSGFLTVVIDGGASVIHPDSLTPDIERDPGYMGAWLLGSSCVRQVPAGARKPW